MCWTKKQNIFLQIQQIIWNHALSRFSRFYDDFQLKSFSVSRNLNGNFFEILMRNARTHKKQCSRQKYQPIDVLMKFQKIIEIKSVEIWNRFVSNQKFLQTKFVSTVDSFQKFHLSFRSELSWSFWFRMTWRKDVFRRVKMKRQKKGENKNQNILQLEIFMFCDHQNIFQASHFEMC